MFAGSYGKICSFVFMSRCLTHFACLARCTSNYFFCTSVGSQRGYARLRSRTGLACLEMVDRDLDGAILFAANKMIDSVSSALEVEFQAIFFGLLLIRQWN